MLSIAKKTQILQSLSEEKIIKKITKHYFSLLNLITSSYKCVYNNDDKATEILISAIFENPSSDEVTKNIQIYALNFAHSQNDLNVLQELKIELEPYLNVFTKDEAEYIEKSFKFKINTVTQEYITTLSILLKDEIKDYFITYRYCSVVPTNWLYNGKHSIIVRLKKFLTLKAMGNKLYYNLFPFYINIDETNNCNSNKSNVSKNDNLIKPLTAALKEYISQKIFEYFFIRTFEIFKLNVKPPKQFEELVSYNDFFLSFALVNEKEFLVEVLESYFYDENLNYIFNKNILDELINVIDTEYRPLLNGLINEESRFVLSDYSFESILINLFIMVINNFKYFNKFAAYFGINDGNEDASYCIVENINTPLILPSFMPYKRFCYQLDNSGVRHYKIIREQEIYLVDFILNNYKYISSKVIDLFYEKFYNDKKDLFSTLSKCFNVIPIEIIICNIFPYNGFFIEKNILKTCCYINEQDIEDPFFFDFTNNLAKLIERNAIEKILVLEKLECIYIEILIKHEIAIKFKHELQQEEGMNFSRQVDLLMKKYKNEDSAWKQSDSYYIHKLFNLSFVVKIFLEKLLGYFGTSMQVSQEKIAAKIKKEHKPFKLNKSEVLEQRPKSNALLFLKEIYQSNFNKINDIKSELQEGDNYIDKVKLKGPQCCIL